MFCINTCQKDSILDKETALLKLSLSLSMLLVIKYMDFGKSERSSENESDEGGV